MAVLQTRAIVAALSMAVLPFLVWNVSAQQQPQHAQLPAQTQPSRAQQQPAEPSELAAVEPMERRIQANILQRSVKELKDMRVVNAEGNAIGDVSEIVRSRSDNEVYAVVSVGGVLGLGDKEVVLPIEPMQLERGRLKFPTPMSAEQLKQAAGAYREENYVKLQDDKRLSDQ